ncbi:hypothetical protein BTR23_17725 [Alkalihalophilus pseudofirmus]|nr:hypothetical protein BTR23_17725 [Alkalihalophilus pseudofirmus]
MRHAIECCFINRLNASEELFSQLEKRKDISVQTFSCIGNCHHCATHSHCILNGERIEAETPELLYEIIQKVK